MCSMISGQCDKLRERAKELRVLANGPVNEGFPARAKLFEAADAMYQAADLILELRDGLQQANDENAKLIVKLNAEHIVRQNVEIENDRLRKACAELAEFLTEAEWLQWPELRAEMRELGIEVD